MGLMPERNDNSGPGSAYELFGAILVLGLLPLLPLEAMAFSALAGIAATARLTASILSRSAAVR